MDYKITPEDRKRIFETCKTGDVNAYDYAWIEAQRKLLGCLECVEIAKAINFYGDTRMVKYWQQLKRELGI